MSRGKRRRARRSGHRRRGECSRPHHRRHRCRGWRVGPGDTGQTPWVGRSATGVFVPGRP